MGLNAWAAPAADAGDLAPLLSEQWFRVAELRPRLHDGVRADRILVRGHPWVVLASPDGQRRVRLDMAAYALAGRCDGRLTLQQLWDIVGVAENALRVIAAFVLLVSLTVMTAALLTSLNERRREMAILRALGARPRHVFALILGESLLLTGVGALLGLALLQLATIAAAPHLEAEYGILLRAGVPTAGEWTLLAANPPTLETWLGWAYLVVFGSLCGFTAYIWLLRNQPAARVATYAYVNPLVAIALGWMLIGEPIGLRTVYAAALMLGGVALIQLAKARKTLFTRAPIAAE